METRYLIILTIIVFSCNTKQEFQASDFEEKFMYDNLSTFKDNINVDVLLSPNKWLIGQKNFEMVFQNSGIHLNNYDYDPIFLSNQKFAKFQAITVLGMDSDWRFKVCLFTYGNNGKLINNEFLYETGGDAENSTEAWGEFVNDSTYYKTKISCEINDKGIAICDTVENIIYLRSNGEILNK